MKTKSKTLRASIIFSLSIFLAACIHSMFADGNFYSPTKEIIVSNPAAVTKTTDDWYRGRVLTIRLSWTAYIRDNPHAANAGVNFSATNWVNMVKSSGSDILMLVLIHESATGFLLYPSNLTDSTNCSPIDYPQLLKTELSNQGLQMGMSINEWGITDLAAYQGQTRDATYQSLVDEVDTRYGNFLKQFWFDDFHRPETPSGNYDYYSAFQKVRANNSNATISFNQ